MAMTAEIDNAHMIKIPTPIIEKANLENSQIEFVITNEGLLLKPIKKRVRQDWEKNIKEVFSKNKKDEAVLDELLDDRDLDEWEW